MPFSITEKFYCRNCVRELKDKDKPCTICGSSLSFIVISIDTNLRLGEFVKFKVRDDLGMPLIKYVQRRKLSNYSRQAKEKLIIDIRNDRKFHQVEEQDDAGIWRIVHYEDKPLKVKK